MSNKYIDCETLLNRAKGTDAYFAVKSIVSELSADESRHRKRIVFDYKYPSLNEYVNACRAHWSKGAKMKRRCDDATVLMIRMQRIKPITGPVQIQFVWHEKTARRDWDNIRFAAKFILDGLVKAGVLRDDRQAYVHRLSDEVVVDGKQYVEVFMEVVNAGK